MALGRTEGRQEGRVQVLALSPHPAFLVPCARTWVVLVTQFPSCSVPVVYKPRCAGDVLALAGQASGLPFLEWQTPPHECLMKT